METGFHTSLLGLRIITSHLFTLISTAQRVMIGIRSNVTRCVGMQGRRSTTWLSVLAEDVMKNKQVFLLEGSGRIFKAVQNSQDGGQHCYFKLPISLKAPFLMAVI